MSRAFVMSLCVACSALPDPELARGALRTGSTLSLLGVEHDLLTATKTQIGDVSRIGDHSVWAERIGAGPLTQLMASDSTSTWRLDAPGADRPVLSPDGTLVAFVYSPHGIASVGVVPFRSGSPIQLTNVGMERKKRAPGQAPDGFVPVPTDDSFTFVGDHLEWNTSIGRMSARLPLGARAQR